MSDALIKVSRLAEVAISLDEGALAQRADALESASAVTQVEGATDQTLCTEVLRDIKRLRKLCESSRVLVKEPVLKLGREIDGKAAEYDRELAAEDGRLSALLNGFTARQRAIAEEAERKRREEIERVEREELQRKRAREQAELEGRRKAEAEIATARTAAELMMAQNRASAAQVESLARAERERKEAEARAVTASAAAVPAPIRAEGTRVKEEWRFEVLDPAKVYAFNPNLCDLEVSKSAVNRAMKAGMRECPGLKIWKEVKAEVLA